MLLIELTVSTMVPKSREFGKDTATDAGRRIMRMIVLLSEMMSNRFVVITLEIIAFLADHVRCRGVLSEKSNGRFDIRPNVQMSSTSYTELV